MTGARILELKRLVCAQLISMIEDDIEGGESLMKEVWEHCDSRADQAVVVGELQELARMLRMRYA